MVRIRYSELPAGLHVIARAERHGTVVYLQPGLTSAQRRAAIIRARSSARMGRGPALPAVQMALAITADRVRTTTRNGAAAARGHPVLFVPPLVGLVTVAIAFTLMSFPKLPSDPNARLLPGAVPTLHAGGGHTTSSSPAPAATASTRHSRQRARIWSHHWLLRHWHMSASSAAASSSPTPVPSPTALSPAPSPTPSPSPSCTQVAPGVCVSIPPPNAITPPGR